MAYGLEINTSDGYQIMDEENHIMVVAEQGTIQGTRTAPYGAGDDLDDDSGDEWIRIREDIDPGAGIQYVTTNYYCTIELATTYSEKPLVAIRGLNGSAIILPHAYPYRHNSSSYNRIRFNMYNPTSVDWILLAPSTATTPTVSGGDYGMQILNSSSVVTFDSRWEELFVLKQVGDFPTFSSSHNYRTSGAPTSAGVTIGTGEQGDFYCVTNANGSQDVESWKEDLGEGLYAYRYGGLYMPSISTTADGSSVTPTMVKRWLDTSNSTTTEGNSGDVTTNNATGGKWMAIRYTNF